MGTSSEFPRLEDVVQSWDLAALRGSEAKLLLVFLRTPSTTLGQQVSIQQLADGAGLSWRTAQAALRRLEQRGLLVRSPQGSAGTLYRWPAPVAVPSDESAPAPVLPAVSPPAPVEPPASPPTSDASEPVAVPAVNPPLPPLVQLAQSKWLRQYCPPATFEDVTRWSDSAGGAERLLRCFTWLQREKAPQGYETASLLGNDVYDICHPHPLRTPSEFQRWEQALGLTPPPPR